MAGPLGGVPEFLSHAFRDPPTVIPVRGDTGYLLWTAKTGLICGKPCLNRLKTGHSGVSYRRFLKMSFYVLSSGRSLPGLDHTTSNEENPCFDHAGFPESGRIQERPVPDWPPAQNYAQDYAHNYDQLQCLRIFPLPGVHTATDGNSPH